MISIEFPCNIGAYSTPRVMRIIRICLPKVNFLDIITSPQYFYMKSKETKIGEFAL